MASDPVGWGIGVAGVAIGLQQAWRARKADGRLARMEAAIRDRAERDPETAERVEQQLRPDEGDLPSTAEQKEALARAIDELPEREKLLVTLYYYEELTMPEIADVLGISVAQVSQLHTKAVLRLKAALQGG